MYAGAQASSLLVSHPPGHLTTYFEIDVTRLGWNTRMEMCGFLGGSQLPVRGTCDISTPFCGITGGSQLPQHVKQDKYDPVQDAHPQRQSTASCHLRTGTGTPLPEIEKTFQGGENCQKPVRWCFVKHTNSLPFSCFLSCSWFCQKVLFLGHHRMDGREIFPDAKARKHWPSSNLTKLGWRRLLDPYPAAQQTLAVSARNSKGCRQFCLEAKHKTFSDSRVQGPSSARSTNF